MVCHEPAVQTLCCYLIDPQEKVHHNFDNIFRLVDLCLAIEAAFEKTKNKTQVAVKDKDLYLTCSKLLRNVFFIDRLKSAVLNVVNVL